MSESAKYPFSYISSPSHKRSFAEDDRTIVITFKPEDSQSLPTFLGDNAPKASIEGSKLVDTDKGKPESVTVRYIEKHTGFARIRSIPGKPFDDTMKSLTTSPLSQVVIAAMPGLKEKREKGRDITKYFLPRRLAVQLKIEYVKDDYYYEKYKEEEPDVDETKRLVFKNGYVQHAESIFSKHNLKVETVYSSPGLFSVSFPKIDGKSETEQLFDALKVYGLKTEQDSTPQLQEAEFVDTHQVGFDAGLLAPTDDNFNVQWGLRAAAGNQHIRAETAWDLTTGNGSKVHVAVLDTGCDNDHPDIRNPGVWSQIKDKINVVVSPPTYTYAAIDDNDSISSHGTNVAGIIGARTNNGPGDGGIAGAAWNCGLYIVKVADPDLTSLDYLKVKAGIDAVAATAADNIGASGKRYVMNLSIKLDGEYDPVITALASAWDNGVVIVAAAADTSGGGVNLNTPGNEVWPACHSNVIIVAAHTNGAGPPAAPLRSDSNFGNGPTYFVISAPGNNNHTTQRGGSIQQRGGTSIAAGFVSGAAALCWSRTHQLNGGFPGTTATNRAKRDQIRTNLTTILQAGGGTIAGRLDARGAVNAMT